MNKHASSSLLTGMPVSEERPVCRFQWAAEGRNWFYCVTGCWFHNAVVFFFFAVNRDAGFRGEKLVLLCNWMLVS